MRKPYALLLPAFLLGLDCPRAQRQASTLEAMTRKATIIATIVVGTTERQGETLRVAFAPERYLRGRLATATVLRELDHRHCGSACRGLTRGARLVLFANEIQGRITPLGGSRGLVHLGRGELAAIEALLATQAAAPRIRLVAAQLDHAAPRVRDDAALALPLMAGLEDVDDATKSKIVQALRDELESDGTRMFGLLLATVRAAPRVAAAAAWQLRLDRQRRRLHGFAQRLLVRDLPARSVLDAAPPMPGTAHRRVLVARVLGALGAVAGPALEKLLAGSDDASRPEIVASLLAAGADARALETRLGRRVLQQATSTLAARGRARFRVIHRARDRGRR